MTSYDRAIAYARERGTSDGTNAAGWYVQDALRSTRDDVAIRRILREIEDGDPAVLDTFPQPDLSGEWADTLTGPELVRDALDAAGLTECGPGFYQPVESGFDSDICDAYELAFSEAVEAEIARAARLAPARRSRGPGVLWRV